MSIRTKRLLFAIGLLIVWLGFISSGGVAVQIVISALAGWFMGGLIYNCSVKVFPDEREN